MKRHMVVTVEHDDPSEIEGAFGIIADWAMGRWSEGTLEADDIDVDAIGSDPEDLIRWAHAFVKEAAEATQSPFHWGLESALAEYLEEGEE